MAKEDYLETNDDKFATQLLTFAAAIPGYATLLELSPAQIASQAADAHYYSYELSCRTTMRNGALQWNSWNTIVRKGGNPPPTGAPVPSVFPAVVTAVAPGIEGRFRALVREIKAHAAFNEGIGKALDIEGSEQTAPDLSVLKPDLTTTLNGNRVEIGWGWGGHGAYLDMCEIEVDRADGKGSVLLTFDTTPGYIDTMPFPAVPTKWTYRAIYRVSDTQIGQWSLPISITVGG